MVKFDDYQDALKAQAIVMADTIDALAQKTGLPVERLKQTLADVAAHTQGKPPAPLDATLRASRSWQPLIMRRG